MIVFVDTETSDLDERVGHLLEVGLVITDDMVSHEIANMSILVNPVDMTIDDVPMEPIVREMHTKNGLIDELRRGLGIGLREAELSLIAFVETHFKNVPMVQVNDKCVTCKLKQEEHPKPADAQKVFTEVVCRDFVAKLEPAVKYTPLAGSTVGFDRRWLREHMPTFEALFHYHSIDVTSFTELAMRWRPPVYDSRPKAGKAHRALDDVRESIGYLKYFCVKRFIDHPDVDALAA